MTHETDAEWAEQEPEAEDPAVKEQLERRDDPVPQEEETE